jgi:hypothetical protein
MGKPLSREIFMDETEQRFSEDMDKFLKIRQAAFADKFGREPGPDDPLVFDPDAGTPTPLPDEETMVRIREVCDAAGPDVRDVLKSMGWGE